MKPFLPPDWTSEVHLHLSLTNIVLENNLSVLSIVPLVILL